MRVAEERHAVWCELQNLIHGMSEALGTLIRQAVNQVHVDAVKTQLPGGGNQIPRQFEWLDAVNRFLYFRMKVLHAHAQTVESQPPQSLQMLAGSDAWVYLDTDFRVRREGEVFP